MTNLRNKNNKSIESTRGEKMKKTLSIVMALMMIMALAACQTAAGSNSPAGETPASDYGSPSPSAGTSNSPASGGAESSDGVSPSPAQQAPVNNASITVISRENGSGTRGAFTELFGVLDENKVDNTADSAEITNSTSVMMTSVAGDPNAIGYISLGSLNSTVKAAKIDGADASVANIKNGSYGISRPFNIAVKEGLSGLAQDFVDYIMSVEGQDVIENNGYIRMDDTGAFGGTKPYGKIVVSGSSSVSPVMEKLIEAYQAVNSGAEIELQTSDSSTGMKNAADGVCDIGMASRDLKDSEIEGGLQGITIATDGIAVIVNNDSSIENLTKDQVRQIFTAEITKWAELN